MARRSGHVVGALVNAVLLFIINVEPGWRALPILTEDTVRVIGLVNLSLVLGLTLNAIGVLIGARWWRDVSDLVTAAVGLVVMVRILQVFPFDFEAAPFDATVVARGALTVLVVAVAIGVMVALVRLAHLLALGARAHPRGPGAR